jgi:hypothetical protein
LASHHGATEALRTKRGSSSGLPFPVHEALSVSSPRREQHPSAPHEPVRGEQVQGWAASTFVALTSAFSPELRTPEVTERCSWYDFVSVAALRASVPPW